MLLRRLDFGRYSSHTQAMSNPNQTKFDRMTAQTWGYGAAMVALGILGVWLWWSKSTEYPYLTIFFYSVPSNAGISLFPHEPLLVWYGKFIDLWNMALVATLGTVVAAFLDYMFFAPVLNLEYSAKFKSTETYKKAHRWFYKFPFWSIVVAGFTPIPFYPFKFMVYATKYPMWRYLIAVVIGRLPRYYLLGKAGQFFQIPDWLIISAFLGMFLLVYYKKIAKWLARLFTRLLGSANDEPIDTSGTRDSRDIGE